IEPPGSGDPFRTYGPDRRYDGMSAGFIAINVGKRSIILDLKQEEGKAVAKKIIAEADVVVENFRPGVIDRLGLGYEVCRELNSRVIFFSISGYGQEGPLKDYPALDQIVQATSGMMSVNGRAEDPPLRVGFPVVDTYTGTMGALAIVSSLLGRERFAVGRPIGGSMFDRRL